jgi:hypothetical protein
VLALGLAAWFFWPDPPAVRAYERIRLGMTPGEVNAAIGVPPRESGELFRAYDGNGIRYGCWFRSWSSPTVRETGIPSGILFGQPDNDLSRPLNAVLWDWEDHDLWVAYSRDGRVVGYYLMEPLNPPPTFFDQVRAWIGL